MRYYCEGGYVSFMLVNNTIVVRGERTAESFDKFADTLTTFRIYVTVESAETETVRLGDKKITVSQPFA